LRWLNHNQSSGTKRDVLRRIALNVIFFAVYLLIFVQAAQNSITTGQAVTLILLAYNIRIPIFTISFLVDRTQRAIADSKDYFEVLTVPFEGENDRAEKLEVKNAVGKNSLELTLGTPEEQVLRDVSFVAEAGKRTALVGESGEGKNDSQQSLLGLYRPRNGSVLIDGKDINAVSQSSLRQNIGVVFQDAALFSGTILDNIIYGKPSASQAEPKQLLRLQMLILLSVSWKMDIRLKLVSAVSTQRWAKAAYRHRPSAFKRCSDFNIR
jgi:ATP-binding cassette subfamily B protein